MFHGTNVNLNAGVEEEEQKLMSRMKETVDKQRDQMRALKRDLSQKSMDLEAVSTLHLAFWFYSFICY